MHTATTPAAARKWIGSTAEAPDRSLRALFTPQQTAEAIHRERCRADRSSGAFSLVLFRVARSIGPSRSSLRLARTVLSRARGTDAVGWFDPETVCALLPDTTAEGAGRFSQIVTGSFADATQLPEVTVFTYPTAWFQSEKTPTPTHAPRGKPAPVLDATPSTPPPRVQALESLFVRRMPWWKRSIDLIGAALALVLFSPLLVLIALGIRLTSPGPALFVQQRCGLGGRPFRIFKFRTMVTDAEGQKAALRARSEQDGPAFKMQDDPRVTRIGRLLRKTSLDELPQLWNVLRGEMSLVGPRPLPIDEQNGVERWQRARLEVTPGLTCIWQVEGRSQVSFADWVRMDLSYLHHRSILRDLKILFATIPAVLLRRGAR